MILLKVIFLISVVIIMTALFVIYMSYKFWGNVDFPGGPRFFAKGKENRAMFVTYTGKFTGRIILPSKTMSVTGSPDYKILKVSGKKEDTFLGMYWIGIWPFYKIYYRHQQWMEWQSTSEGRRIRHRDEMTPFLIVKPFEYAMYLENGEDKKGLPLDVWFTVILEPVNAYTPIFGIDDAYGQVQTLCLGQALLYLKTKEFAELGKDLDGPLDQDDFCSKIKLLNNQIPGREPGENILKVLGYKILDTKINSIAIGGELKNELLKTSVLEYQAQEKAKAQEAEAEGIKKSKIKIAEGESQATILKAQADKIAGMLAVDVEKYNMDARKAFYDMLKVEGLEFAQQIELAKKIFADSNLTTYVGGKKEILPTFNVGGK